MTHKRAVKLLMSTEPNGTRHYSEGLINSCPKDWTNEEKLIYWLDLIDKTARADFAVHAKILAIERTAVLRERCIYASKTCRRCELILNSLGAET